MSTGHGAHFPRAPYEPTAQGLHAVGTSGSGANDPGAQTKTADAVALAVPLVLTVTVAVEVADALPDEVDVADAIDVDVADAVPESVAAAELDAVPVDVEDAVAESVAADECDAVDVEVRVLVFVADADDVDDAVATDDSDADADAVDVAVKVLVFVAVADAVAESVVMEDSDAVADAVAESVAAADSDADADAVAESVAAADDTAVSDALAETVAVTEPDTAAVAVADTVDTAEKVAVRESAGAPADGEAEMGREVLTERTENAASTRVPSGSRHGLVEMTAAAEVKFGAASSERSASAFAVDVMLIYTETTCATRAPLHDACRRRRELPAFSTAGRPHVAVALLMTGSVWLTLTVVPSVLECADTMTCAGVTRSGASAAAMSQRSARPREAEREVSDVATRAMVSCSGVSVWEGGGGGGE